MTYSPRPKTQTEDQPEKKPIKPSTDGEVTIAELALKAKISPSDARQILRQKKIPKPAHGRWSWPQQEAKNILKIIS